MEEMNTLQVSSMTSRRILGAVVAIGLAFSALPSLGQAIGASYITGIKTIAGGGIATVSGQACPHGAGLIAADTVGDGCLATDAVFSGLTSASYDAFGNLYVVDTGHEIIRRIDAVTGVITVSAGQLGTTGGYTGDGGAATAATIALTNVAAASSEIAFDLQGNYYFTQPVGAFCYIRKVTAGAATPIISTYAGNGKCSNPTANTPAIGNGLNKPWALVLDNGGNLTYGSQTTGSHTINATTGILSAVYSGGGTYTPGPIAASSSKVGIIPGLSMDNAQNMYISDFTDFVVSKIVAVGDVLAPTDNFIKIAGTVGSGTTSTGDGGPATSATLDSIAGVYADRSGRFVYIATPGSNSVRVVDQLTGLINTYAGNGSANSTGDGGATVAATLSAAPQLTGTSTNDRIAIVDAGNSKIRLTSQQNVFPSTAVGSTSASQNIYAQATTAGSSTYFGLDSTAPATGFTAGAATGCPGLVPAGQVCSLPLTFAPTVPGIATSRVLLTDSTGVTIAEGISGIGLAAGAAGTTGPLNAFAGTGSAGSSGDGGAASSALMNQPAGAAVDAAGNVYIADTANNKLRMVSASTGNITTIAGTGTAGSLGDGGAPASAQLSAPSAVAIDPAGNIYIADTGNNKIRVISIATGKISTFAGGATAGSSGDGGAASSALLSNPKAIASDMYGNIYIADTGNNKVREVFATTGYISTIFGTGVGGSSADGTAAVLALTTAPAGVAVDTHGTIYVSTGNSRIRTISGGLLGTFAGNGTAGYTGDGAAATSAELNLPGQLALDAAGDLYIADTANHAVREVSAASGFINTVAGTGNAGQSANGLVSNTSNLRSPAGVAVTPAGNFYVADTANNRVVFVNSAAPVLAFGNVNRAATSPTLSVALQNYGNQTLTITGMALTGSTYFTQLSGNPNDCTATTTLAPGAYCIVRATFTPTTGGSATGTLTFTDNALGSTASTQTISLTGNGIVTPAFINITAGNNQTGSPLGQYPIPLTVKVTDAQGFAANNATVTFTVIPNGAVTGTVSNGTTNAISVTTTTALDGTANVNLIAAINTGTFTVNASVIGVSQPALFNETIAGHIAPVVTLTTGGPYTYGNTVTVNSTLSPADYNNVPTTGTMTFSDNGTQIGTAQPVTTPTGTSLIMFTPLAGTNSITAVYSGDSNYATSSTLTPLKITVAKLGITATATSVSIPYGTVIPAIPATLTGVLTADVPNVTGSFAPATSAKFPDVAVYPLSVTLAGTAAPNYSATVTGNPTLTITQANTTTKVVVATTPGYVGLSSSFTATVASTINGGPTPTGNVVFTYGSVTLGTASLGVNGTATISTTLLPQGTDVVTATYQGSTDYAGSNNFTTQIVDGPDFTFSVDNANITMSQGSHAVTEVRIVANPIFNTAVTYTCLNLPAGFNCIFTPNSTVPGFPLSTTQDPCSPGDCVVLTIASSGSTPALPASIQQKRTSYLAGLMLSGLLFGGAMGFRKRLRGGLLSLFLVIAATFAIAGLSGCGSGVNDTLSPIGANTITIQGQSTISTSPLVTVTHTQTITVNITSGQ